MNERDPRFVPVGIPIDQMRPQPRGWIGRLMTAQQRAGEQDDAITLDRLGLKQDCQVGCELFLLAEKERLFPNTPWSTVVMIPWNDHHRDPDRPNRSTRGRHGRFRYARRIEQVTRDDHHFDLVLANEFGQAVQNVDPCLLDQGAFLQVGNTGKRFAKLPVSRMEKFHRARSFGIGDGSATTVSREDRVKVARSKGPPWLDSPPIIADRPTFGQEP